MTDDGGKLAPCGVYCGACPSFGKSCFGCSSQTDAGSRRRSREGCAVRSCCYREKGLRHCGDCPEFPCGKVTKKLISSHPGDPRYRYRHELPDMVALFRRMERGDYLRFLEKRWSCPACGGVVHFYRYRCSRCGKEVPSDAMGSSA